MIVVILIGVRVTGDSDLVCLCHASSIAQLGVYYKVFFALLFIFFIKKDLTPPQDPPLILKKLVCVCVAKRRGEVFINLSMTF